jgi:hypothetical protein
LNSFQIGAAFIRMKNAAVPDAGLGQQEARIPSSVTRMVQFSHGANCGSATFRKML